MHNSGDGSFVGPIDQFTTSTSSQPESSSCSAQGERKTAEQTSRPSNVGYGQPPVGRRFAKGRSGNPKGRPPRSPQSLGADLHELLNETLATADGKTITKRKVLAKQLITLSVEDPRALKLLHELDQHGQGLTQLGRKKSAVSEEFEEAMTEFEGERFRARRLSRALLHTAGESQRQAEAIVRMLDEEHRTPAPNVSLEGVRDACYRLLTHMQVVDRLLTHAAPQDPLQELTDLFATFNRLTGSEIALRRTAPDFSIPKGYPQAVYYVAQKCLFHLYRDIGGVLGEFQVFFGMHTCRIELTFLHQGAPSWFEGALGSYIEQGNERIYVDPGAPSLKLDIPGDGEYFGKYCILFPMHSEDPSKIVVVIKKTKRATR